MEYGVSVECRVVIKVAEDAPEDVFTRMMVPENYEPLYGRMDQTEVAKHFADNAVRNGVDDASYLDGWQDLPRFAVRLSVEDAECVEQWIPATKEWVTVEGMAATND